MMRSYLAKKGLELDPKNLPLYSTAAAAVVNENGLY